MDIRREIFECPASLVAFVERFDSLQCVRRACGGNPEGFKDTCVSCPYYLANAQLKDLELVDSPIPSAQRKGLGGVVSSIPEMVYKS